MGSDGKTPDQRDAEAEQEYQDAVVRRYAVDAPDIGASRSENFFDEDDEVVDDSEPEAALGDQQIWPSIADTSYGVPADEGHAGEPEPTPPQTGQTGGRNDEEYSGTPHAENEDFEKLDGNDAHVGVAPPGGDYEPPDRPGADDAVLPPGSLWESTHGPAAEPYDPGAIITDPEPDRAEPGAVAQWIKRQYQRLWVPLGTIQKVVTVVVVVALCIWGGQLVLGAEPPAPVAAPADPIIDTPAPPAGPTPAPLVPKKVEAPGCPARSQPAIFAFDGKPDTAWVCVRAFNTDLQTVFITFAEPVVVCSIFVVPGFEHVDSNGRNRWNEHRIVTSIMWQVGGKTFPQEIDPSAHTGATVQIPCVATQVVIGKIFRTVPPPPIEGDNGPSDEDINSTFAVSTITVNGYPAGGPPR
ncbi:hypothetical protein KL864_34445 [Mycolicibacterium goodii]|uniref:hypothetical protein n=1 Tax=Mycolicibacterium goodii TaxID=134601 RepID=UPI001BDDC9CB|nr:hypothetical protein [Mycolicibacterium goodii]MBU8820962.1 hypothetical protein [Mycolicibacterium goodii]